MTPEPKDSSPTETPDASTREPLTPDGWLNLVESADETTLRREAQELHPADVAALLEHLPFDAQKRLLQLVKPDEVPDVISELDEDVRQKLLRGLPARDFAKVVADLDTDDAADLLGEIDPERSGQVLAHLPHEDRAELHELLAYPVETAGGIMDKDAVSAPITATVEEIIEHLRRESQNVGDIYNIYLIDEESRLKGRISLKDLILAAPSTPVSKIMETEIFPMNVALDREEVAALFARYNLVSAPVVDSEGRFLGRITHDDILDVLAEEMEEDWGHLTGHAEFDPGERSLLRNLRYRLPWLLLALAGELGAATMLSHFEPTLIRITALAFFMPLIAAMGGNAGIQTSALMVRGLATGEISNFQTWKRLVREIGIALLAGLLCSGLLFIIALVWQKDFSIALVVSLALVAVILAASTVGILVPLTLKRLGLDPAVASGPFITTTNDIFGLLIYMLLATFVFLAV